MNYPNRDVLAELKAKYHLSTVVALDKMANEQAPDIGTAGVVTSVDDIGTIHVDWFTGSSLGVAYSVDEVHIATAHEAAFYYINREAKERHDGSYCPLCGVVMEGKIYTHVVSRRANIIICDTCGAKESLEYAIQAGVMKGRDPLSIEDRYWYIVKKNTGGKHPFHIEATEEIEDGSVVGYTVTVPECPRRTACCEKPDEIIPTGVALLKNIKPANKKSSLK